MTIISKILKLMLEYQKIYQIKNQCVLNCNYIYHNIKMLKGGAFNIKPKTVIVIYGRELDTTVFHVHMVLETDNGEIIDPSYEINSIKLKQICKSIKEFTDKIKNDIGTEIISLEQNVTIKEVIKKYLSLQKYEDRIINSFVATDSKTYNDQADFVQAAFS
jgi:hypothetical protein